MISSDACSCRRAFSRNPFRQATQITLWIVGALEQQALSLYLGGVPHMLQYAQAQLYVLAKIASEVLMVVEEVKA